MMNTKLTYAVAIDMAIEGQMTEEVIEKLQALKTSLQKKSGGTRKQTPTQKENEVLKEVILDFLADGGKFTISEMLKEIPQLADISNQRVSAILRQLKLDNKVVREEIKRKAYFSVAE